MYKIKSEAIKELKALHAGIYALKHRILSETEKEKIRTCIKNNFDMLDKLNIPFKIQNKVIQLAENRIDFIELTNDTGIIFI